MEDIVALQARKAALANAILDGGGNTALRFSAEDLDALLAPLPPAEGASDKGARRRRGE